jgi:hypothetical protein
VEVGIVVVLPAICLKPWELFSYLGNGITFRSTLEWLASISIISCKKANDISLDLHLTSALPSTMSSADSQSRDTSTDHLAVVKQLPPDLLLIVFIHGSVYTTDLVCTSS